MEFIVLDHAEAIAQKAADAIEELLASKPNAVLGTATGVMNFPPFCPAFGTSEFRALLKVQVDIKPLSCRVQLQGFDKPRRRYAKR